MSLSKSAASSNHDRPCLLNRGPAILVVIVIAAMTSACPRDQDASRSPDTASSATASQIPQALAPVDTQHVVLAVKGMYCTSCEQTVGTMLRRTAGVLRAEVSVEKAEATVSYDASRTSPDQLIKVVKTLGYDASVKPT